MRYPLTSRVINKEIPQADYSRLTPEALSFLNTNEECLREIAALEPEKRRNESRDHLIKYLARIGWTADSRALFSMGRGDDFELYTPDLKFLGCSRGIMRLCSYSVETLFSTEWSKLFRRPDHVNEKIIAALGAILSEKEPIVRNVTDWHMVEEYSGGRVNALVRIKSASLARDIRTNEIRGIIGIIQIQGSVYPDDGYRRL